MQARSIVFDLFGDYVRENGGSIPLRNLAQLLECFGIGADSARVIMSRVTREGWFQAARHGRESTYRPTDRGWALLDSGLERIVAKPGAAPWDGTWFMAIFSVPESKRAIRAQIKTSLTWLGFASTAAGVWISPNDRLAEAEEVLSADESIRFELYEARSRGPLDDADRVNRAWDVDSLALDYREFVERCATIRRNGIAQLSGRESLVLRTEIIHAYRLFLFRDPDLPAALLPHDWPARDAHAQMTSLADDLRPKARAFYQSLLAG